MKLKLLIASVLTSLGLVACTSSSVSSVTSAEATTPKNVIFFLGDGYGIVPMTATRVYAEGESGSLAIDTLPETAFIKTYSLDAQVTDSAPSMAAYMTGVKTRNEVLAMDGNTFAIAPSKDATTGVSNSVNNCPPAGNGKASSTLLELAIGNSIATGVVSTARLTHATPAATYAHVCHRNAEYEIARQAAPGGAGFNSALGSGVDVLMGGVSQYWTPFNATTNKSGRPDGRDLVAEMKTKGYSFANDLASTKAAPVTAGSKLLALFDFAIGEGHMSYELDRDPSKEPSLSEMTTKAMDILANNKKGYFLMVEGGRIDHALHSTNAARALAEGKAFDDAVKAAIAKVKLTDPELKNTLIVVTADHDHTMIMNGYSALTGKTTPTNPGILGLMRDYLAPATPALDADGSPFTNLLFGNGENRVNSTRAGLLGSLTDLVVSDKNYRQEAAVQTGIGGETHGGADVFLGAVGMKADTFFGVLDNTDIFGLVKSALGL